MELLVSLIAGAVGGNLAAGLAKNHNMGLFGNSVGGVIGGGLGWQAFSLTGAAALVASAEAGSGLDTGLLASQAAAGGAGGAVILLILGALRNLTTR